MPSSPRWVPWTLRGPRQDASTAEGPCPAAARAAAGPHDPPQSPSRLPVLPPRTAADRNGGIVAQPRPNSSTSSQCRPQMQACRAVPGLHECGVKKRPAQHFEAGGTGAFATSRASSALPRCSVSSDRRTHHCPRRPWQHSPPAAAGAQALQVDSNAVCSRQSQGLLGLQAGLNGSAWWPAAQHLPKCIHLFPLKLMPCRIKCLTSPATNGLHVAHMKQQQRYSPSYIV